MSLPPSDFADAFRRHVVPKLREAINRLAWPGYDGELAFGDMMAELHRLARQMGAGWLPGPHWNALDDWMSATLLTELERSQAEIDEADFFVASLLREPDRMVLRAAVRDYLGLPTTSRRREPAALEGAACG